MDGSTAFGEHSFESLVLPFIRLRGVLIQPVRNRRRRTPPEICQEIGDWWHQEGSQEIRPEGSKIGPKLRSEDRPQG